MLACLAPTAKITRKASCEPELENKLCVTDDNGERLKLLYSAV